MADLIQEERERREKQIAREKKKNLISKNCSYGQHQAEPEIAEFMIGDKWFYVCLYCQATVYKGKVEPLKTSTEELTDPTRPALIPNRTDLHQGHK